MRIANLVCCDQSVTYRGDYTYSRFDANGCDHSHAGACDLHNAAELPIRTLVHPFNDLVIEIHRECIFYFSGFSNNVIISASMVAVVVAGWVFLLPACASWLVLRIW